MAMKINAELCTDCGDCEPLCPTGAIVKSKGLYTIKESLCSECDDYDYPQCEDVCETDGCIVMA